MEGQIEVSVTLEETGITLTEIVFNLQKPFYGKKNIKGKVFAHVQ